jgi:hypothetical protein
MIRVSSQADGMPATLAVTAPPRSDRISVSTPEAVDGRIGASTRLIAARSRRKIPLEAARYEPLSCADAAVSAAYEGVSSGVRLRMVMLRLSRALLEHVLHGRQG